MLRARTQEIDGARDRASGELGGLAHANEGLAAAVLCECENAGNVV